MKKIKITESQYQRLLTEQSTDQDCIDQLGKNYKVIPVSKYEQSVSGCKTKPSINCILTSLNKSNVDNTRLTLKELTGGCAVIVKGKQMHNLWKSESLDYLTFWEDNSLTYTRTLHTGHVIGNKTYVKVMFEGKFDCSSGRYSNLEYSASVTKDGKKEKDIKFPLLDNSGNKSSTNNDTLLSVYNISNSDTLQNLYGKTTEL